MTTIFLLPKSDLPNESKFLRECLNQLGWEFVIENSLDTYYVVCNQTKETINKKFKDVKFYTKRGNYTLEELNKLPKQIWFPFKGNNCWYIKEFPLFNTAISRVYTNEYHYNGFCFDTLEQAQEYCIICIKKECIQLLTYKQVPDVHTGLIEYVIGDKLYGRELIGSRYGTDYSYVRKQPVMTTKTPEKVIKSHCRKFLNYVK